jgi:hypothetical protein
MEESAQRLGRKAERSDAMDNAVRYGLVVYGLLHLIVAWLAVELALGRSRQNVSSQGAFQQLAQDTLGRIVLAAVAGGMLLMVVWQALEAFAGHADRSGWSLWLRRFRSAVTAVIYGFLTYEAAKMVFTGGQGGSGRRQANSLTARLMDLPAGQVLVGVVGLVVFGVGVGMSWHSLSGGYGENLSAEGRRGEAGRAYLFFGRLGYLAKGVGACLVGAIICYAAVTHDPQKSGGLDQAVRDLVHWPAGGPIIFVIAAGIGCYGLFCFARSRHLHR